MSIPPSTFSLSSYGPIIWLYFSPYVVRRIFGRPRRLPFSSIAVASIACFPLIPLGSMAPRSGIHIRPSSTGHRYGCGDPRGKGEGGESPGRRRPWSTSTRRTFRLSRRETTTRRGKGRMSDLREKRRRSSTGRGMRFGSLRGLGGRTLGRRIPLRSMHLFPLPFPSRPIISSSVPPRTADRRSVPCMGRFRVHLFLSNLSFRTRIDSVLFLSTIPFVSHGIDVREAKHVTRLLSCRLCSKARSKETQGRRGTTCRRTCCFRTRTWTRGGGREDTPGDVEVGRTRTNGRKKRRGKVKQRGTVRPGREKSGNPCGTNWKITKQGKVGDGKSTRRNQDFRP